MITRIFSLGNMQMLDAISARNAALRLELVRLDALALEYPGMEEIGLAGCHLQRAIDFLDNVALTSVAANADAL